MGDFIFMMVECSRTDDYAIFRNKTCSSLCEFRAKKLHTPLTHHPKCTLLGPQNFAQPLFSISLGMTAIPRRNENNGYAKLGGGWGK